MTDPTSPLNVTPGPGQSTRSRSQSIISTTPNTLAPPVQYSPHTHPATDPTLLALTQQQVGQPPTPTDPALLGPLSGPHATPTAFPLDPALGGVTTTSTSPTPSVGHSLSPSVDMAPPHTVKEEALETEAIEDERAGATGTLPDHPPKRTSGAVEDSDAELRRLAEENKTVELAELARRVRNEENSPSAERTRQIYGLGWLQRNCERVSDTSVAVPRNRVYARYVSVCANERIKPLNPASFGKLVRLMFPEIKTRRLGVRGHSKYHYCGIRLAGENSSPRAGPGGSSSGSDPSMQVAGDDHLQCSLSNGFSARLGILGSPERHYSGAKAVPTPLSYFMLNELCFLRNAEQDNLRNPHDAFKIPDIRPHVPVGTDPDIAATLTALYRSHCTSLVECIRYMRLKQFLQLFVSFHGTLTVPVQKLLSERSVAPWIRESDWVMYKEMIRLLSPLALQVVPSVVLSALRQLSTTLVSHITATFSVQPPHVMDAKTAPASIFASLLDRLLRVNDAAHAAARFLGNPPDRDQMVKDWKAYVNARSIVEREIPCIAPLAKDIIEREIPNLLEPEDTVLSTEGEDSNSTESVLDRWTYFLTVLPHRFRIPSARHFNIYVGALATAALRDLTTNGAISFGSWWVVRCWVDEWMSWQAEKGGFLNHGRDPERGKIGMRRVAMGSLLDSEIENESPTKGSEDHLTLLEDLAENRVNIMAPAIVRNGK